MTCQRKVAAATLMGILIFMAAAPASRASCTTPLGAPHQGAGRYPSPGSYIYGASATISCGNPTLGCLNDGANSFTGEWDMVVSSNGDEWLQFGWQKEPHHQTVQGWSQYHSDGGVPVNDWFQFWPTLTDEYKIMSVKDPQTGVMSWWLVHSGYVVLQVSATQMGWTQPTVGGSQAQWSAELPYDESQMGALLPNRVTFDSLYDQEGAPANSWYQAVPSWYFASFVRKYGGDPADASGFNGQLHNWTRNQVFLPFLENDP